MQSMTGFGRATACVQDWHATVEISTVNRKQAEVVVQAPRELQALETQIRTRVLGAISRGRIQVAITLERPDGCAAALRLDESLAAALDQAFAQLGARLGRELHPTVADYLRQPGILDLGCTSIEPQQAWAALSPALDQALEALVAMRTREGEDLARDFLVRLATLEAHCAAITSQAQDRPQRQKEALLKRLSDAGLALDVADERVLREIALFADRCDISEELTRLHSHFAKFREYLAGSEPAGRPLDFLCQELFREFNTIGSKANDAGVAQVVVEAKTELEKIREQVQNVE